MGADPSVRYSSRIFGSSPKILQCGQHGMIADHRAKDVWKNVRPIEIPRPAALRHAVRVILMIACRLGATFGRRGFEEMPDRLTVRIASPTDRKRSEE
ncbi:hypothetical protein ACLRDC_16470 [Gluconacetobacter sacchari]|nr:hypothetical protein [Gluconacetobacter sacchari]